MNGKIVDQTLTCTELLDRQLSVCGVVGPVTGRVNDQVTIAAIDRFGLKAVFVRVYIGDCQAVGNADESSDFTDVFGYRTSVVTTDDGGIVNTGDGNGDSGWIAAGAVASLGGIGKSIGSKRWTSAHTRTELFKRAVGFVCETAVGIQSQQCT